MIVRQFLFAAALLFVFTCCQSISKISDNHSITTTAALIKTMHKTYKGKWFNAFTFVQETITYENEQPKDTAIWYEAVRYPKQFRIDYGAIDAGNAVLFDHDSVWVFKEKQFVKKVYAPREFLLMKGGLYHFSVKEVIRQLEDYGYDTEKFYQTTFNGKAVYVIGGTKEDLKSKQFWLDATHFYMVRRIAPKNGKTLDVVYSEHEKYGEGWVEGVVDFWMDGVFIQKEFYKKVEINNALDVQLFDWTRFGQFHWWSESKR